MMSANEVGRRMRREGGRLPKICKPILLMYHGEMKIPQFGIKNGSYRSRPGAYAIVTNHKGKLLVISVRGRYHLPGGGLDKNEDPIAAVIREVEEETGYKIAVVEKVGEANQFLQTSDIGHINKLGKYFRCRILIGFPRSAQKEKDHYVRWIDQRKFLSSSAHEFHKWAVEKGLGPNGHPRMKKS